MFHCISHGKIPYNALQIYLIFYALLFLSVAASRMADGISRIIDSIWLMSIFFVPTRDNTRTHVGENACRCEFNYFRSEAQALSSPLRKFNVPETCAGARLRRGKRWELCSDVRYILCSVRRDELSRSEMRCCCSGSLRTGWKETGYTDAKVFLTKSSRRMRRSRSSDILLSALHSFHSQENYDLCEIKLRCPNWSLLMWSISEVSSVFLTEQEWDAEVHFKTAHLSPHFYFFVLNISFISYSRLATLKERRKYKG